MIKNAFIGLLAIVLVLGFIGCDDGNGNTDEVFKPTTNETISNDINSLGLVGTSVSSSNENIATAVILSGKIKITSVGNGSAIITVSENSKNAVINITVSSTGNIIIETIEKYSGNGQTGSASISVNKALYNEDGSEYTGIDKTVTAQFKYNKDPTSDVLTIGEIKNGILIIEFPEVLEAYLGDVTGDIVTEGLKDTYLSIGDSYSYALTLKIFPDPGGKNEVYFHYSNKDGTASWVKGGYEESQSYIQGWHFRLVGNSNVSSLDDLYELGYRWCYFDYEK